MRLSVVERWISLLRLAIFPPVLVAVALAAFPPGWEPWAWVTTAAFALGAAALFLFARVPGVELHPATRSVAAQVFDTTIIAGYVLVFSYAPGVPVQQILYLAVAAACVRFEIAGGLVVVLASVPVLVGFERLRSQQQHVAIGWQFVIFQTAIELIMALILGWLVRQLVIEHGQAESRAREAEVLRDELRRRADRADAAYESERRTVEELRRLSSLRADFVSMVSHEVRTPMAAVIGAAQTLRRRWRGLGPDQRDAFLGLIDDETERLAALVGEVLDSERIEEGTFSYRFAELDLGLLVGEAIAAAELGRDGMRISASLAPGLPTVRGDPTRLRQVLTNLIDNAVKYSPEGAPIEVRTSALNGGLRVEVVDRGIGISPDDQELIFEKFARVRGSSSATGSGLGLYIARAIAEAHDGALEVSSTPGEGSTFTLRLPVR